MSETILPQGDAARKLVADAIASGLNEGLSDWKIADAVIAALATIQSQGDRCNFPTPDPDWPKCGFTRAEHENRKCVSDHAPSPGCHPFTDAATSQAQRRPSLTATQYRAMRNLLRERVENPYGANPVALLNDLLAVAGFDRDLIDDEATCGNPGDPVTAYCFEIDPDGAMEIREWVRGLKEIVLADVRGPYVRLRVSAAVIRNLCGVLA